MLKAPMRPALRTAKAPTKPQPGHSGFRKPATTSRCSRLRRFLAWRSAGACAEILRVAKPPHRATPRRLSTTTWGNRNRHRLPAQQAEPRLPLSAQARLFLCVIYAPGESLVPAPTHYSASSGSDSSSKRTSILSIRRPSITRAIIVIFVPS